MVLFISRSEFQSKDIEINLILTLTSITFNSKLRSNGIIEAELVIRHVECFGYLQLVKTTRKISS